MALWIRYNRCANCSHTLYMGTKRFGPAIIECRKCGSKIKTGLTPWRDLSPEARVGYAFAEIVAPSFAGSIPYALIVNFITIVILLSVIIFNVIVCGNAYVGVAVLVIYILLLCHRLYQNIKLSNAFSDGEIPIM